MSIQILPAQLANQIAAGEVVERPASVVKELIENSLDAGATSIELDIEHGGHKRICIRDNGKGISQQELALALSRHATSKISSLDDLENITSMGFRGEALASISSVSRLRLTSRPQDQTQAWQAQSEGRDMEVRITPAAHPTGTTLDVEDLFFNTPARRKFLRTEKTEFAHIDEVLRRIALSRFDVAFILRHNGKVIKKYPTAMESAAIQKRIGSICGQNFAQNALQIKSEYQGLALSGWLGDTSCSRSQSDLQYFYVNGRMMKDKLINHAIRQAFEGLLAEGQFACFVLYLEIDPIQVDVNVHPAKHEVRFHQSRLVHDFILRALNDALADSAPGTDTHSETGTEGKLVNHLPDVEPQHDYITPLNQTPSNTLGQIRESRYSGQSVSPQAASNYQQLMSTSAPATALVGETPAPMEESRWIQIDGQHILIKIEQTFWLLPLSRLFQWQTQVLLSQSLVPQPLLMPVSIQADESLIKLAQQSYELLLDNGIEIGWSNKRLMLRKVPAGMRETNWSQLLPVILEQSCQGADELHQLIIAQAGTEEMDYSSNQTNRIWQAFTQHFADQWKSQIREWARPVALQQWLQDL